MQQTPQELIGSDAMEALNKAGFTVVPAYPTETMMDAGLYQSSADSEWEDVFSSWRDMVQAAENSY